MTLIERLKNVAESLKLNERELQLQNKMENIIEGWRLNGYELQLSRGHCLPPQQLGTLDLANQPQTIQDFINGSDDAVQESSKTPKETCSPSLINSLISNERENAMNLPSQAEIQAYAREHGIPLIKHPKLKK